VINLRQHWYLDALAAGRDVRADDLCRRWSVSEKTARRDVAALKRRGMIEFVGSRRSGRYQLSRCLRGLATALTIAAFAPHEAGSGMYRTSRTSSTGCRRNP
jgi:DNA-binding IclR family transcriptional regulator